MSAERALRFTLPARHWFVRAGFSEPATAGVWYVAAFIFQLGLFSAVALSALLALRQRWSLAFLAGPLIVFGHLAIYAASYASPRHNVTIGPTLVGAAALAVLEYRRRHSGPVAGAPETP